MQHSWTSPPTRRELFLLTFSLSIFVLAYNADAVLSLIRHPATLALPIGPDGRKGAPHTDALEDAIAGTWDWAPNRIAGLSDAEDARTLRGFQEDGDVYVRGEGRAGQQALWLRGVGQGRYTTDKARLGDSSINEEFVRWGSNVPRTSVALHAPGFTVLDNVTLAFGTFFLVGEDDGTLPRPEVLGSSLEDHSKPPRDIDWQILPTSNSVAKLGTYGGRMHGTTFVSYDDFTDGHTLLTLTRLHSLLPPPASPLIPRFSFAAPGPSPARLLLPAIRTFTEPGPDPSPKSHSSTGVHPSTLLAAYPSLAGPLFHDDFDDFTGLSGPMLIDRVIVVDRGAAARSLSASTSASSAESGSWVRNAPAGVPPHLAVFAADENKRWFQDVRRTLWEALGFPGAEVEKEVARGQEEIAYVVPKEGRVDEGLVKALRGLGRTVHVLGGTTGTSWAEHMRAVARSSIIVSPSGPHLSDAAFIRPGPRAALVELFPPGAFDRDWEVVMSSMGHGFVGFQGRKRVDNPAQHPISRPASPGPLQIDANAVADSVKEILARH